LTPDELRTEYDVHPLLTAGNDGAGQTISFFELSGYNPSDIITYRHHYHLADAAITNVLIDGATNTLTSGNDSLEVTLDIEVAAAMAPGAAQKIYIGPNTLAGVADIYNRIVTDNVAKVVSISWGECEAASTPARLDLLDTIFKQGAVQGQAFLQPAEIPERMIVRMLPKT
jgi:subtilase family serine protease